MGHCMEQLPQSGCVSSQDFPFVFPELYPTLLLFLLLGFFIYLTFCKNPLRLHIFAFYMRLRRSLKCIGLPSKIPFSHSYYNRRGDFFHRQLKKFIRRAILIQN